MKGDIPAQIARRRFLTSLGAAAAATAAASFPGHALGTAASPGGPGDSPIVLNSPFRVAVINDEISQDFGRACEVASREFGMEWIELRGMWNKNLLKLDAKEIEEARRIL